MEVVFRRQFKKDFKKLHKKIQLQFGMKLELLLTDEDSPLLRVHQLKGDKYPMQSMNITGDYRALFQVEGMKITFYEVGTHSELYG